MRVSQNHTAQVGSAQDPLSICAIVVVGHSSVQTICVNSDIFAQCIGGESKSTAIFSALDHSCGIGIGIERAEFTESGGAGFAEEDLAVDHQIAVEGIGTVQSKVFRSQIGGDGAVGAVDDQIAVGTGVDSCRVCIIAHIKRSGK